MLKALYYFESKRIHKIAPKKLVIKKNLKIFLLSNIFYKSQNKNNRFTDTGRRTRRRMSCVRTTACLPISF